MNYLDRDMILTSYSRFPVLCRNGYISYNEEEEGYKYYTITDTATDSFPFMAIKSRTALREGECIYRFSNATEGPSGMKIEIMFIGGPKEKKKGQYIVTTAAPLSMSFASNESFDIILDHDEKITTNAYFFYQNNWIKGIELYIPVTMSGSFYDITISKRNTKIANFRFRGERRVNFILQTVKVNLDDKNYASSPYMFCPLRFESPEVFSYQDDLMIGGKRFSFEIRVYLEESPRLSVNLFMIDDSKKEVWINDFVITGALQLWGKDNEITFDPHNVPDFKFDDVAPNGVTQIFKPVKSTGELYLDVQESASSKVYEYLVDIVKTSESINEFANGEIRLSNQPYEKIADIVFKQIDGSITIKKAGILQFFCNTDTSKGLKAFKVRFITHNPENSTGELEIVHIDFSQNFKSFLSKQKIVGESNLKTTYAEHEWYLLPEE